MMMKNKKKNREREFREQTNSLCLKKMPSYKYKTNDHCVCILNFVGR